MNMAINIILLVLLALGTYAGFKKGLIKGAVQLIGLVAIIIISYTLRYPLVEFLINKFPFFSFNGYSTLTILLYNVVAFVLIFVLLYCLLNIILTLTGFIDTLLKFTIIWEIPSKIGGAIIGFLEMWVFLYLVIMIASSFNVTAEYLKDSKVADIMINHTPIVGTYLRGIPKAASEIYDGIKMYTADNSKTQEEINLYILQLEINYGLITKQKAQELVDIDKVSVGDVLELMIQYG